MKRLLIGAIIALGLMSAPVMAQSQCVYRDPAIPLILQAWQFSTLQCTQSGELIVSGSGGGGGGGPLGVQPISNSQSINPATSAIFEVSPTSTANTAANPFFFAPATSAIFQVQSNSQNLATQAAATSILAQDTLTATASGTPADAAWTSGSGSIIALMKAVATNTLNPIQGFVAGAIPTGPNFVGQASSENHTGEVGSNAIQIQASALGVTNIAHATNTCVGLPATFSNAVRVSGALGASGTSSYIQNLTYMNSTTAAFTALDAVFFNSTPGTNPCTGSVDGGAFSIAAGDNTKVILTLHMVDLVQSGAAEPLQIANAAFLFNLASSTTLTVVLVNRGASVTPVVTTAPTLIGQFLRN